MVALLSFSTTVANLDYITSFIGTFLNISSLLPLRLSFIASICPASERLWAHKPKGPTPKDSADITEFLLKFLHSFYAPEKPS
jgi:hypothetical protein